MVHSTFTAHSKESRGNANNHTFGNVSNQALSRKAVQFKQRSPVQKQSEEHHTSTTRFIMPDGVTPHHGQISREAFLAALHHKVSVKANGILSKVGESSADCPYIAYWFSYYANKDAAHIEEAITKYAPEANGAKDWETYTDALVGHVATSFSSYVSTGVVAGIPEGIPKDLHEKPESQQTVVQKMDAAQLCEKCCGGDTEKNAAPPRPDEHVADKSPRDLNVDIDFKEQLIPAVEKIKNTDLKSAKPTFLGGSRSKRIYLFDAEGDSTDKKGIAVYMVDISSDKNEYKNAREVEKWGVRIPRIYGETLNGHPIVQWLSKQTTVGGAGGTSLVNNVKLKMRLDNINKQPFALARWQQTLRDVNQLIKIGYTSPDLQFMIDEESGHIYIMDLETNNTPQKGKADDKLIDMKSYLENCIANGSMLED